MYNTHLYDAVPDIETVEELVHEQNESCGLLAVLVAKCSHDLAY